LSAKKAKKSKAFHVIKDALAGIESLEKPAKSKKRA